MLDPSSFEPLFGKWWPRMRGWVESEDGWNTYQKLKERSSKKNRILPESSRVFETFRQTDPANINCIMIGLSPYHTIGKNGKPNADGLCYSCGLSKEIPPSLKLFYDAIDRDLDDKVYREPNLEYLCSQGVMLLNASLTTEQGKATIHNDLGIWDGFNKYFYKEVLEGFCGIPVLTMGTEAKKLTKYLFPMCHLIKSVEHPAAAARLQREWRNEECFRWINSVLEENNRISIEWDYTKCTSDLPW